jgi:hypothetical protein
LDLAFGSFGSRSGTLTDIMYTYDAIGVYNQDVIGKVSEINRKKRYESGAFNETAVKTRELLRELKRKGALNDKKKYEAVRRRFEANY